MSFDRSLIDKFAAAGSQLREAVAGLSREQLTSYPVPGTWSIAEIVVHLMDSDLVASDRMKRVAAEPKPPLLIGYDETAFAKNLFPTELPLDQVLTVFDLNRQLTAEILRRLPDEAFERFGIHNEAGKKTLGELVTMYVWHFEHHLGFIQRKREMVTS